MPAAPRRRPAPTTAKRRQPLSRERIVDAAVALADAEGIEAVGMRSVARRLGVDPMSLYNHVDGKTALFDGIAERVIELADLPGPGRWDEWARVAAQRCMDVALAHPGAFSIIGSHPVATVAAASHFEPFVAALLDAGFPPDSCQMILNTFFGFVASYGLMRTRRVLTAPPGAEAAQELSAELQARLPALKALSDLDVPIDPEATFHLGVELLIDGLRARLRRERRR
jgi:AcrR family transcriptional regulator